MRCVKCLWNIWGSLRIRHIRKNTIWQQQPNEREFWNSSPGNPIRWSYLPYNPNGPEKVIFIHSKISTAARYEQLSILNQQYRGNAFLCTDRPVFLHCPIALNGIFYLKFWWYAVSHGEQLNARSNTPDCCMISIWFYSSCLILACIFVCEKFCVPEGMLVGNTQKEGFRTSFMEEWIMQLVEDILSRKEECSWYFVPIALIRVYNIYNIYTCIVIYFFHLFGDKQLHFCTVTSYAWLLSRV